MKVEDGVCQTAQPQLPLIRSTRCDYNLAITTLQATMPWLCNRSSLQRLDLQVKMPTQVESRLWSNQAVPSSTTSPKHPAMSTSRLSTQRYSQATRCPLDRSQQHLVRLKSSQTRARLSRSISYCRGSLLRRLLAASMCKISPSLY